MAEDRQLIRQYAADGSEQAFAELVRRHLKMVYSAALRQVHGDTHLAEDVAQTVFADLARKARTLQRSPSIAGWLFVSTRFSAANAVRAEARRRERENKVAAMNEINPTENDGWNELRPLIDGALGELGETDRESIVLRYFQGCEFSMVGAALGVSENAARMRVDRALEKLRIVLQKRGLATTAAALGSALANSPGAPVPAQLAATIISAALAKTAIATAVATPTVLTFITMKNLAGIATAVAFITVATALLIKKESTSPPQTAISSSSLPAKSAHGGPIDPASPPNAAELSAGAYQKVVQGHDAQAKALKAQKTNDPRAEWEKMLSDLSNSPASIPGLTNYWVNFKVTLPPGQSVVTSGRRTPDGNNVLVLVTPQVNPDGAHPNEIFIASKMIEVSDGILDRSGFGELKAATTGRRQITAIPNEAVGSMFQTMTTNAAGADLVTVLTQPKISSLLGMVSQIAIGSSMSIDGSDQFLGTKFGFFPNQSGDGNLVLEMVIQSTAPLPGELPQNASQ